MSTAPRHLEFAPPPTPGFLRALGLAILAHGVLLAVLSVGVQWKRDPVQQSFEAELWSALPVDAAPPAPLPTPAPEPKPVPPTPVPVAKPVPPPPDTAKIEADIALLKEKEKAKQLKEKKLALEKAELEKKKLAELEKQKLAKLEQDKKDKLKKEQTDKVAKDKEDQRKLDAKEAANLAKSRDEQIRRLEKLAGNGSPSSTGTAAQSSGPSASYLGRLAARVKPNIVFTESVNGNPAVEVDVRTSPAGNILSARVTKSSGNKAWDDAVLRAIDKTEVLPRDADGTIPSLIPFAFRPKD